MSNEPSTSLVVDASVILKVLLDPSMGADALGERLVPANLIAPAILPFEVTNVLRRRRNAGLLSHESAEEAFLSFSEITVDLWPWSAISRTTWGLGHNLSTYDAAYVAVALEADATLLTCDARIARAPGAGVRVEVISSITAQTKRS
ncbi:type II toxin-antitoxin system VapC family toxin [Paramicrobacterium agarici]|uniref:type II toxin-antitoxin system VapC family toxin n=1 Tax=Paramicrobacterium agarici TaxID=630514 RepID=UPI00114F7EF4|nr:type II toxin-antitoxin system VapC family toxin [Microbacterium agarici]TQO23062.1 putative nucleic acid-binding protein [Microbacterium agarici]